MPSGELQFLSFEAALAVVSLQHFHSANTTRSVAHVNMERRPRSLSSTDPSFSRDEFMRSLVLMTHETIMSTSLQSSLVPSPMSIVLARSGRLDTLAVTVSNMTLATWTVRSILTRWASSLSPTSPPNASNSAPNARPPPAPPSAARIDMTAQPPAFAKELACPRHILTILAASSAASDRFPTVVMRSSAMRRDIRSKFATFDATKPPPPAGRAEGHALLRSRSHGPYLWSRRFRSFGRSSSSIVFRPTAEPISAMSSACSPHTRRRESAATTTS
mmetsp:Transcript_19874/g.47749  ORF Transcript_19874/g.47749 Transcript_19874/m.47749 type:complete len:275 (-) Transcript_19874:351-1175(-)